MRFIWFMIVKLLPITSITMNPPIFVCFNEVSPEGVQPPIWCIFLGFNRITSKNEGFTSNTSVFCCVKPLEWGTWWLTSLTWWFFSGNLNLGGFPYVGRFIGWNCIWGGKYQHSDPVPTMELVAWFWSPTLAMLQKTPVLGNLRYPMIPCKKHLLAGTWRYSYWNKELKDISDITHPLGWPSVVWSWYGHARDTVQVCKSPWRIQPVKG